MATATPSKSAPVQSNPNGLTNTQVAQGYSTIPGSFNPVTGALNPGASKTDASGGTTTNVTGQAPQVLGSNGQPVPGAPKLDANGNIIPGTGSATTANSATATNITSPLYNPPAPAPLNTTPGSTIPATSSPATQGGIPGLEGETALNDPSLSGKYNTALSGLTAGGSTAPVNPGDGSAAASNAANTAAANTPAPQTDNSSGITATLMQNPIIQQMFADQQQYYSAATQGESLQKQFQDLQNQYNIPGLQTQMMNLNNIINGTSDDIKNEITASGGFATQSQVLALSDARNKQNILNLNNDQAQLTNATAIINSDMQFAQTDHANALAAITEKMGFDDKMLTYSTTMQSQAKEGYNNIISAVGYSGLYNGLINSDPTGKTLTNAAQLMGVTPAELKTAAAQDAKVRNLDIQQKQASINASNSTTAKNNFDMQQGSPQTIDPTTGVPQRLTPYLNTASNGTKYIDASTLQGTAAQKTALINQASAAGLKVITNKNTAADLINIQDAKSKLDTINTIMAGIGQPNALARTLGGLGMTKLATMFQTDPQKAAAGALQSVGLDVLKAISGVQGFRGNATAVQQVTDHLPKITDTVDTINQKVQYIDQLISDRENAALGTTSQSSKTASQPTLLSPQDIPSGMYQASDGLLYRK